MLVLGYPDLGLSWGEVEGAAALGVRVLQDPYLPQVLVLAQRVADTNTGPKGRTPNAPGIGLQDAIFPLKAYLYVREHAWAPWVIGAAALTVPFLLGLATARLVWK